MGRSAGASGPKRRPRGIAFVIVLWVMALLAVLLGSFVVIARTENLQTRHLFDTTQARYAAEAGISRASYELRRTDPLARWVPDGRVYELEFDGAKLKIEVTDESGKIDINAADEPTLLALFQSIGGVEAADAQKLVDAVIDFRDPDDLVRPYGALDQNFAMPEELQQVLGMSYELYRKLEPHLTTYGLTNRPNAAFASATVLQTLPGITPDLATQIVEQRWLARPGDPAAASLTLPDGTPVLAAGGGGTYTVRSRATLPNRAWTILEATIRLGGAPGARAYSVLRWREGSAE